jgi:hypothetical protein
MIAQHLVRKNNVQKWQVHYLISMLYKSYLLSLRRLKKDNNSYGDNFPDRLRWLWCAWVAKILGWREARLEDHPNSLRALPPMPSKGMSPFKCG